jgi:hypothetical protein
VIPIPTVIVAVGRVPIGVARRPEDIVAPGGDAVVLALLADVAVAVEHVAGQRHAAHVVVVERLVGGVVLFCYRTAAVACVDETDGVVLGLAGKIGRARASSRMPMQ